MGGQVEQPTSGTRSPRSRAALLLRLALAAGIFVWLVRGDRLDTSRFEALHPGWAVATTLFMLGILVLPPVRWWLLCRGRGLPIGLRGVVHIALIGTVAGRLMWGSLSNDAVRLAYMGSRHPGQRMLAMSTVVVDRYLGALALFALGPIALALLWERGVREPWLLSSAGFVGALCAAAVLLPYAASSPRAARLLGPLGRRKAVGELHGALAGYRGQRAALGVGLALSLVIHGTYLASCWCALAALGYPVDPLAVCAVMPLIVLASQVPLTPLALGVKEGVAEELFRLTGMEGGAEMVLVLRVILVAQGLLCLPSLLVPLPELAPDA